MSTLFVDTINEKTSGNGIKIPGHQVQIVQNFMTHLCQLTLPLHRCATRAITPKFLTARLEANHL